MIKVEFTKEELQIIAHGLAELPAKISVNLLIKVDGILKESDKKEG